MKRFFERKKYMKAPFSFNIEKGKIYQKYAVAIMITEFEKVGVISECRNRSVK